MLCVVERNRDLLFKTEAFKNRMPVSTVASGELWRLLNRRQAAGISVAPPPRGTRTKRSKNVIAPRSLRFLPFPGCIEVYENQCNAFSAKRFADQ